ncbi:hypothetical protein [Candidatus Reidiella endopervernicosa]|uniref:Spy/CpxP family protein refolding chaperone n=1 Tax=Candidatus Reidiella endopervernicosa TaxID=2738883 RepID=A0A6N0HS32_9GAMM|nr:hypothetical protein [Candidatus Reidiella endopervernicosa]QKQ25205.1 hypothetical protein HUE57_02040 [Candidatus Reidiella endopervernicosa]
MKSKQSTLLLMLCLLTLPSMARPPAHDSIDKTRDCQPSETCHSTQQQRSQERMPEILSLRDEQVEEVMNILERSHEKRHALQRRDKEQRQLLHEETVEALKPLLNEQQLARFVGFTAGMRMAHQRPPKNRRDRSAKIHGQTNSSDH